MLRGHDLNVRLSCDKCEVRDRALCSALPSVEASRVHRSAYRRVFQPGRLIACGDRPPDWYAVIVSGVVKLVKSQADGRQQIVALQFPADFVGRPFGKPDSLFAEAATELELCCFSKPTFESLLLEHPGLEHALLQRTFDELEAARRWMFVLGRQSAQEKLASFLLLVMQRLRQQQGGVLPPVPSGYQFELPLSRTEIGEYLGLTIETVSRQFRQLKLLGILDTQGKRSVIVHDLARLEHFADGVVG
jgi:CRP/FNR family transcriptional regulator